MGRGTSHEIFGAARRSLKRQKRRAVCWNFPGSATSQFGHSLPLNEDIKIDIMAQKRKVQDAFGKPEGELLVDMVVNIH